MAVAEVVRFSSILAGFGAWLVEDNSSAVSYTFTTPERAPHAINRPPGATATLLPHIHPSSVNRPEQRLVPISQIYTSPPSMVRKTSLIFTRRNEKKKKKKNTTTTTCFNCNWKFIFIQKICGSWFYSYSKMASSITTNYICCGILYFDTNISKWDWTWNLMTTKVVS